MDQLKIHQHQEALYNHIQAPPDPNPPLLDPRPEGVPNDSTSARKLQKADREKLRRDRLNEQFTELGTVLDPDRPKNDKASIVTDAIQVVKDLSSQIDRLKAEYATLNDESRELTQEKNDLREEKASLKADIESLNAQYQQRVRAMYPWGGMDHSIVMHPASYPYPMPMPMPAGPMPMHPSMQPFALFGNQNPAVVPNPVSTFVPYMPPNGMVEQQSTPHGSQVTQQGSRSHGSRKQDSSHKTKDRSEEDVATNLELKTPGSGSSVQDVTPGQGRSRKPPGKDSSLTDGTSSSRCSSSRSVQAVSSNSVVGGAKTDECS